MNFNVAAWTPNQWQAAGKHVLSYAAGGVTVAVAFNLLSSSQGAEVTSDLDHIWNGVMEIGKGVAGLAAVFVPIYTSFKAATRASPASQVASVKAQAPDVLVQAVQQVAPATLRDAVAAQPEVKAVVVTTQALADASPSPKVQAP